MESNTAGFGAYHLESLRADDQAVFHAEMVEQVSPFNEALSLPWVRGGWGLGDPSDLAALGDEILRQATMIGYLNAFGFFALPPSPCLSAWRTRCCA